MENFLQIIVAAVVCLASLIVLWQLEGRLLKKAQRYCGNERISVCVSVKGSDTKLETTVRALNWLRQNGDLPAQILIIDDGMDADTALAARLLADKQSGVSLVNRDQLEFFVLRSSDDGHDY